MSPQDPSLWPPDAPSWLPEALLWAAVALIAVSGAIAAGVWTLVLRMRELRRESARLAALDEAVLLLRKLAAERDDLDLRRLEHLLIDQRDVMKRLEDAVLRSVEGARGADGGAGAALVPRPGGESIGERVVNRLLSLGYERVHLVTRSDKLAELAARDGEVLVEARRDGVLHKGRVLVRGGGLADVEIHPAYSIFP